MSTPTAFRVEKIQESILSLSGSLRATYSPPSTTADRLTQIQDLEPHTFAQLLLQSVIAREDRAKLVAWFSLQLAISGRIFMTLDDHALTVLADNDRETYAYLKSLQEHPYLFISSDNPLLVTQPSALQLCLEELLEIYDGLKNHDDLKELESAIQSVQMIDSESLEDPRHFPIVFEGYTSLQTKANSEDTDLGSPMAIRDEISAKNVSELQNTREVMYESTNNSSGWLHDDSDDDIPALSKEQESTIYEGSGLFSAYTIQHSVECDIFDTEVTELATITSQSLPDYLRGHAKTSTHHSVPPVERANLLPPNGDCDKFASGVSCGDVPSTHGQPTTTYHADTEITLCTTQDSTSILRHCDVASKFDSSGETVNNIFGGRISIEINRQGGEEAFSTDKPNLRPISVNLKHDIVKFGKVERLGRIVHSVEETFSNDMASRSISSGMDIFQISEILSCSSPKDDWADLSGTSGYINEFLLHELTSHHPCDALLPYSSSRTSTVSIPCNLRELQEVQPAFVALNPSLPNDRHALPRRPTCAGSDERFSYDELPSSGTEGRLVIGSAIPAGDPLSRPASSYTPSPSKAQYTCDMHPGSVILRETSVADAIRLPPLEVSGSNNEEARSFYTQRADEPENHPPTCYLNPGLNIDLSKHILSNDSTDEISPTNVPHPVCDLPIFEPGLHQTGYKASCDSPGSLPFHGVDPHPEKGIQNHAGVKTVSDQGHAHEPQEYIGGNGNDTSDPLEPICKKLSEPMLLPSVAVSPAEWSLQEEIFSCLSFDIFPARDTSCDVAEDSPMTKSLVANYDDHKLSLEEGRSLWIAHDQLDIFSCGQNWPDKVVQDQVAIEPRATKLPTRPKLQKLQLPPPRTSFYTDAAVQTDDLLVSQRKPLSGSQQDPPPSTILSHSPISTPTRHIFDTLRAIFIPTFSNEVGSTKADSPALRRRPRVQIEKGCIYPAFRGPMSALAKET